jgi:DNA-binding CsgD family transcriptional regulator
MTNPSSEGTSGPRSGSSWPTTSKVVREGSAMMHGLLPAPRSPAPPSSGAPSGVATSGRAASGRAAPDDGLTARESEVLVEIAQGSSNSEISGRPFVSEATVKTHVNHQLAKTACRDRAALVAYAYAYWTGRAPPTGATRSRRVRDPSATDPSRPATPGKIKTSGHLMRPCNTKWPETLITRGFGHLNPARAGAGGCHTASCATVAGDGKGRSRRSRRHASRRIRRLREVPRFPGA